jgi:hypothetical protein
MRHYGFQMLRPDIELKINGGIEPYRGGDDNNVVIPDEDEEVVIADGRVDGLGEYGVPLKVVYTTDAVTIQIDVHESDLPMGHNEIETLLETEDQIALSDMAHEKYGLYESIVIDTVANELGKYYDGDNDQAMKQPDTATLVYPSDAVIEPVKDPHVISFVCQLLPSKFWELT